jgi:hypothetical protein
LYFYDFDQGLSSAPSYFSVFKAFLIVFFFLATKNYYHNNSNAETYVLYTFFAFFTLNWFVKVLYIGFDDYLVINFVIPCAISCFFLYRPSVESFNLVFKVTVFVLFLQVLVDCLVYFSGISLWNNKAFIGGTGNPTSFGFLCNLAIVYLLFTDSVARGFLRIVIVLFLILGVVFTSAIFQILICGIILVCYFFKKYPSLIPIVVIALSVAFYFDDALLSYFPRHVVFKYHSVLTFIAEGSIDGVSKSIWMRVIMHQDLFDLFLKAPLEFFFWGGDNASHYIADSQYLTLLGSYGIFPSVLFIAFLVYLVVLGCQSKTLEVKISSLMLVVFLVAFFANRVVDYYPTILYFLMILTFLTANLRGTYEDRVG